jgi:hypothetical protein
MTTNKKIIHYLKLAIYAILLLVGESAATLLGRLYYQKGGKSKWLVTVMEHAGFPFLIPYYTF